MRISCKISLQHHGQESLGTCSFARSNNYHSLIYSQSSTSKSEYDYTIHATATVDNAIPRQIDPVIQIVDVTTSPALVVSAVDTSSYDPIVNTSVSAISQSVHVEREVIMIGDSPDDDETVTAIPHTTVDVKQSATEMVPVFESEVNNVSAASGGTVLNESLEETLRITSHDAGLVSTQGNTKGLPRIAGNIFISNGVSTPKRRILQDLNVNKLSNNNVPVATDVGTSKVVSSRDTDIGDCTHSASTRSDLRSLSTDIMSTSQAVITTSAACNDTSLGVFAPPMAKRKLVKSPMRWSAGPTNDNTIVASSKGTDVATPLADVRNLDDPIGHFFKKYKWHLLGGITFVMVFTIILIVTIASVVSLSSTYYVVSHSQYPSNSQVNIDTPQQYSQASPMYTPQQQDIIMQEFQNILSNPSYALMNYGTPVEEQIFHQQHLPKLANLLRQTIVKIIYSPVWFIGNSVKAAWSGINRLLNFKPKTM